MHRCDEVPLVLLQPLRHRSLHLRSILIRMGTLSADHLEEMVCLVPTIVGQLARLKVGLDFVEAFLCLLECLFDTDDMKIDAINWEFLISCLREDLFVDPEHSRV